MNVYLVRKGSNQIEIVTFSKRKAIARAAKLANDCLEQSNARAKKWATKNQKYELRRKLRGHDAKIWCSVLWNVGALDDGKDMWSNSFWVQQHQLLDTPLEMLASEAE